MPEQLKYYIAPLLGLILVGGWFLLRPQLGPTPADDDGKRGAALVRPAVKPLDPLVEGGVSKPGVVRIVGEHHDELVDCYAEALRRSPGAAGRLIMSLSIDHQGKVAAARVAASQVSDEGVGKCFGRVLAGLQFPIPPRGNTTDVTYPFDLRSEVDAAVEVDDPPTG